MDKPILLADENIHAGIIARLRESGFEVVSIRGTMGGASDRDVLLKANSMSAILITEDSDFGELIFSYDIPAIGVLYLRYAWFEFDQIVTALITVLSTKATRGSFFTITPQKIRERKLP